MLVITEKIKPKNNTYFRMFYFCPICDIEFPLMNSIYYCVHCRRAIVDVKLILESPTYALRYHFGLVKEAENPLKG